MREFNSNFGVYVCPHVFKNERPVLLVIRDPDGDWQFLCGDQDDDDDNCHLVGVEHLLKRDDSLAILANMEKGAVAERSSVNSDWEYSELDV